MYIILCISGGSLLDHLCFVDDLFGGGVLDDRNVFKCWSNIGLIIVCNWSWAFAGLTSKKDEDDIGFICDSIYLVVSGQFVIDSYT